MGILTSAIVILVAALVVRSREPGASAVAVTVLLVVNSAVLASRHLPSSVISDRMRTALLVLGAGAAAALLPLADTGFAATFGFFIAGHAGYRFSSERAIPIAVLCSAACGGVLISHLGPGTPVVPWYVGVATGLAAPLGMVNRSRQVAVTSALAAADAAERAARAEARESVLAERGRIARDVHDVLAHSLASVNMQLEMADALLEHDDSAGARQAVQRSQSLVRAGLVEARRAVQALREDVVPLVETLTAMTRSAGHPDPPVVVGERRELDTSTNQALVRVAQESLTNAHKHAPGARVRLTLTYEAGSVTLQVLNDAPPAAPAPLADTGGGMGLVGMRERLTLLGGMLTAGPVSPSDHLTISGWQVCATIPA